MPKALTSWFARAVDALLPAACLLCRREAGVRLCADCARHLGANGSACARCAQPLPQPAPLCGHCLQKTPAFDASWAALRYEAPLDGLIQRLKFAEGLAAIPALRPHWSQGYRAALTQRVSPPPDALVPIPLHASRLRQRGYNQALELARALAADLALPVLDHALQRTRATAAQPGLDREARWRNVRGAFRADAPLPARIALIDDVMTTGATLDAAARALKAAGVQWVEAVVLARRP